MKTISCEASRGNAKPATYYGPQGLMELRGHPGEAEVAPFAKDAPAARTLFDELQKITGVTYDLKG